MTTLDEMKNLKIELELLSKVLEKRNAELNDILTKKTDILDKFINDLSNENVLLQSISQNIDSKLGAAIPQISAELDSINQAKMKKFEQRYFKIAEKHTESLTSSELKLKNLEKDLLSINSKKIKRFFLGVSLTAAISVSVSVAASYFMMRNFPLRAIINHPEQIILNESQVSLWGTDNTKVLKGTK